MKVAVVGIGRVGLPLAVVSSKHHETLGIDVNDHLVRKVNERAQFPEANVNEYLVKYNLSATIDFSKTGDSELVLICVGTQLPGEGYSTERLRSAIEKVTPFLTSPNQVLCIVSTVPPGDLQGELERLASQDAILGVCYSPTMIALGDAINGFEKPDYLLIGESNSAAGAKIESFWRKIVGQTVPIFHSSIANITLAKYALNTALVMKISLMNLLTELCEKAGGDVDVLSEIMKVEPRVAGPKMFKGGLGYGGTCFPVDIEALEHECKRLNLPTDLATAIKRLNARQVDRSVDLLESFGKRKIAVMGLTFKPNTSVVVASQSLEIAEKLASDGHSIIVYDPKGMGEAERVLDGKVLFASSKEEAISFGDVIFLGVEWPELSDLQPSDFRHDQVVVDPWRMLRSKRLPCKYYGFGMQVR